MPTTALPEYRDTGKLYLYSKPGCHLCELLIDELLPMIRGRLELEVINIESRAELTIKYGIRIPVVEYEGHTVCKYHLDAAAIRTILSTLPGS